MWVVQGKVEQSPPGPVLRSGLRAWKFRSIACAQCEALEGYLAGCHMVKCVLFKGHPDFSEAVKLGES